MNLVYQGGWPGTLANFNPNNPPGGLSYTIWNAQNLNFIRFANTPVTDGDLIIDVVMPAGINFSEWWYAVIYTVAGGTLGNPITLAYSGVFPTGEGGQVLSGSVVLGLVSTGGYGGPFYRFQPSTPLVPGNFVVDLVMKGPPNSWFLSIYIFSGSSLLPYPAGLLSMFIGGPPTNYVANPTLSLFTNQKQAVSCVRASAKLIPNATGTYISIPNNIPAIYAEGLASEFLATNELLWCRDLTNAVWIKTNMTAALTATGIDGVVNTASTITATASNATVGQTITGSFVDATIFLRRRLGLGSVGFSANSGTNYLDVTSVLSAAGSNWTRVNTQAGATLVNPQVLLKLGTSGDKIDVDYGFCSDLGLPDGPILTTGSTAVSALETYTVANPVPSARGWAAFCTVKRLFPDQWGGSNIIAQWLFGAGTLGLANSWGLWIHPQGFLIAQCYNNDGSGGIQISSPLPTNAVNPGFRNVGATFASGGNVTLYIDGVVVASGISGFPGTQPPTIQFGSGAGTGFQSDNTAISDIIIDFIENVNNCIIPKVAKQNSKLGAIFGDSITAGAYGSLNGNARGYTDTFQSVTGVSGYQFNNFAQNGFTTVDVISTFASLVAGKGYVRFTILIGINDFILLHSTPGALTTNLTSIVNSCLAESNCERVVIGTIVPGLNFTVGPDPAQEPDRQTVNTAIRGFTSIDSRIRVVDVDAAVKDPGSPSNYLAIYDSGDHLHPTPAGHAVIGTLYSNALTGP